MPGLSRFQGVVESAIVLLTDNAAVIQRYAIMRGHEMGKAITDKQIVYIVDDDEGMRLSLTWLVESAGFRVYAYGSALTFLADVDDDADGCAIVDVHMPGMDGVELHRRLVDRCPDMPVIFITGGPRDTLTERARRAKSAGFYTKPLNTDILLDRIRNFLLH